MTLNNDKIQIIMYNYFRLHLIPIKLGGFMIKRYSIKRALLFFGLILFLDITFGIIASMIYATTSSVYVKSFLTNSTLLTLTLHLTCFIIPCFIYMKYISKHFDFKSTFRFNKFNFKNLIYVLIILILLQPIISLISYVSSLFFTNVSEELLFDSMQLPYLASLFIIGILPAISEELIFRGIILSNCDDNNDIYYSVLNGFLFGALHGNFSQFFYAFLLGVVFYFFVKITNSLFISMIAHFLINGSQVTMLYFYYGNLDMSEISTTDYATSDLTVIIYYLVFSCICIPLLYKVFKSFAKYNNYSLSNKLNKSTQNN